MYGHLLGHLGAPFGAPWGTLVGTLRPSMVLGQTGFLLLQAPLSYFFEFSFCRFVWLDINFACVLLLLSILFLFWGLLLLCETGAVILGIVFVWAPSWAPWGTLRGTLGHPGGHPQAKYGFSTNWFSSSLGATIVFFRIFILPFCVVRS